MYKGLKSESKREDGTEKRQVVSWERDQRDLQACPFLSFSQFLHKGNITCERPCQECNLRSLQARFNVSLRLYADTCAHAHRCYQQWNVSRNSI